MKLILKVLLFILTAALLSQCEKDEPNPEVKIPDENFLNALIELGVDKNGDGIISSIEAEAITLLTVWQKSISDMTGIKAFVNLEGLGCGHNQLISLDVSHNTALKYLYFTSNQLTTLDLSNNTDLIQIYLSDNQLTTLDVSNHIALGILYCENNQLTTLDVSNATALYILNCSNNQLTTLDVSDNTALYDLYLKNMPSLYKVCVWKIPFPFYAYTFGSPNIYFTTDCSR